MMFHSMGLVSCSPSGALNFEVIPSILENGCTLDLGAFRFWVGPRTDREERMKIIRNAGGVLRRIFNSCLLGYNCTFVGRHKPAPLSWWMCHVPQTAVGTVLPENSASLP